MAQGSLAYFGTYSVNEADKSYTVRIEGIRSRTRTGRMASELSPPLLGTS